MMNDSRRQKRKAIRESKKNLTNTKIDDNLAINLDMYLTDKKYFQKQLDLCYELKLDYPPKAKSGYELPLFNKNPITNEIEIHSKSAELFTAYQFINNLADLSVGLDDESTEYKTLLMFMSAADKDPSFATYIHEFIKTGTEDKDYIIFINENTEKINKKLVEIFGS